MRLLISHIVVLTVEHAVGWNNSALALLGVSISLKQSHAPWWQLRLGTVHPHVCRRHRFGSISDREPA